MKKLLFLLITIHCSLFTAKADEGMWTLYNLPNAVYETMKMENYELPYGALYEFAGPDIAPEVTQHLRDAGKIAVLMGSLCSGILGSVLISVVAKLKK